MNRHRLRPPPRCLSPPAPASAQPGPSEDVPVPTRPASDRGAPTVTGKLGTTKGRQPTIGGLILRADDVAKFLGDDWFKTAVGKKVKAWGVREDYQCKPMEQCLTSGSIPYLRQVTAIELVAP